VGKWTRLRVRLTIYYAVAAALWIIVSGLALYYLTTRFEVLFVGELLKGLLFVLITTALVYSLLERATRDIRQLEQRFRIFADNTFDWEYWIRADGTIEYMSPSCERITGYKQQDFHENPALLMEIVHPDDVSAYRSHHEGVFLTNSAAEVEFRIRTRDGRTRWIGHACRPVFDANGSMAGRRVSNRDITDRKTMEAERAEHERLLQHRQRLETLGVLSGSLFHEINNPLTGIVNYAHLINEDETADARELARQIIQEAERITAISRNLLSVARVQQKDRQNASPKEILDGVMTLVSTLLRHDDITLMLQVPAEPLRVECCKEQIQQVLLNLVMNARDALNAKYPSGHENKRMILGACTLNENGRLWQRFYVEDHGLGLHNEVAQRVFEPFFTTKIMEQGTGLGLSISRRIVDSHDGRLHFESSPGEWTRFFVDLPMNNKPTAVDSAPDVSIASS